jgi:ribosomal protein L7/L12
MNNENNDLFFTGIQEAKKKKIKVIKQLKN